VLHNGMLYDLIRGQGHGGSKSLFHHYHMFNKTTNGECTRTVAKFCLDWFLKFFLVRRHFKVRESTSSPVWSLFTTISARISITKWLASDRWLTTTSVLNCDEFRRTVDLFQQNRDLLLTETEWVIERCQQGVSANGNRRRNNGDSVSTTT